MTGQTGQTGTKWLRRQITHHSCDTFFTHLKRAVAKDAGEDGSGQHGDDGQDHRHAVCGGRDEELICVDST